MEYKNRIMAAQLAESPVRFKVIEDGLEAAKYTKLRLQDHRLQAMEEEFEKKQRDLETLVQNLKVKLEQRNRKLKVKVAKIET